ncbi:hypothetical protein [Paraburkholderia dilworthii]|uniref:hypothetical protein n=1 Tax=Paraburkholderia dilworthii TaxID=948106 RepID=UPI000404D6FE|nr:hypothetical protein [Paraburkholderia dilworthii]
MPYFIRPGSEGLLTTTGFVACTSLLGVTALLNPMVVRWLLNVNSTITGWKILVPVLTIIGLMTASRYWNVLSAAPDS